MATTNPKPQLLDKYSLEISKVLQVQCLYPIPLEGIESMWYIPLHPRMELVFLALHKVLYLVSLSIWKFTILYIPTYYSSHIHQQLVVWKL